MQIRRSLNRPLSWKASFKTLALLALSLTAISVNAASAKDDNYQSKFQSEDWSDSEIIAPKKVPLGNSASSPSSVNSANAAESQTQSLADVWPTELPKLSDDVAPANSAAGTKSIKLEVSESVSIVAEKVASLKKAPESKVYDVAKQALADSNYQLAIPLFQMLSARAPRDPRYFYGAALAQNASGSPEDAFPNFFMAWHLSDEQVYADAATQITNELKKRLDPTFKLTYTWNRNDPQAVLNAGTRLWKAGLTAQAVQLFEYALKNYPLYRGVAAYNLGAISEHNSDLKRAAQFYEWALKQRAAIQAAGLAHPEMAAEVVQMEKLCPTTYMETALADVRNELHDGGISSWNGWTQATSTPQYWSSEVCPLCAISRTSLKYDAGQMDLR